MAARTRTKPTAKKTAAKKTTRKPTAKELAEIRRARRAAARDGKGAFQGKKRAGLTGGRVRKEGYDKVVADAIADSKKSKTVLKDGTVIRNEASEAEYAKRAANRRAATRDSLESVEKRNVARAGGDAAKVLEERRRVAVYEAYIRGRESGLGEKEAKAQAKLAGEAFDRAEATKAKKAAEAKPKAPKVDKINPSASAKRMEQIEKEKSAGKSTKAEAPKAKTSPKPPAGETPANASGNKPASATSNASALKKVETFTSQIQDVETEMKNNRAALRSGQMSQADFDAKKAELTGKKNELMKARKAVAAEAGIDLKNIKAEEGSRPARNPKEPAAKKTAAKKTAAKKTAAKKTSVKPSVAPKVDNAKAIREVDSKMANVIEDFKKDKDKAKLKSRMTPLVEERARLLNGGKPAGTALTRTASGARTVAEATGRARTGSRTLVPRTSAGPVVPKTTQAAVSKATGLTWEKAGGRLKGFFGKGLFGKAMAVLTIAQVADLVGGLISDTGILEKMPPPAGASGGMGLPTNSFSKDKNAFNLWDTGSGGKTKSPAKPKSKKPEYPNIPNKYQKPSAPKKDYKGYRVKRGDTMWDIAKDNGVTLEQLYKANPIIAKRTAEGKVDIFANTLVKIPKK